MSKSLSSSPLHIRRRLAALAGGDLVSAWIAAMRPCAEPLSTLLVQIEDGTGVRPTLSRLGEWRNGRRPVPPTVQRLMRRDLCRYLCADDDLGDALAARLEPPS